MIRRHLVYPARTRPERLPSAALADILDRGDFEDWRPIAAAVRRRPFGALADRILALLAEYPIYGTSPLWRAWIDRCRIRALGRSESAGPLDLAALRRSKGLTQADVAARLKMSQSDLSKLERRGDVRLSSLRAYAKALGGRMDTVFESNGQRLELTLGSPARRAVRRRRTRTR